MSENKIPWKKCLDVCTDRAKDLTGSIKGVVSRIIKENPECSNSHCALHRHQLATKGTPPELSTVSDDVIKIVNFVKSRPLKARIFSVICKEMRSRENFCYRLKWSLDALLYMSFESRTPNFRLIDVGFAYRLLD